MKDINLVGNAKEATDFMGQNWTFDCIGCAMGRHELTPPGGLIYESENFYITPDPEVPINGFLVINTKKHVKSITELNKAERFELIELTNIAIKALKDLGITEEVTLIREERSFHFHLWIFPTHDWMIEKFGKGISYIRDICFYARERSTSEDKKEILNSVEKIKDYISKNIDLN